MEKDLSGIFSSDEVISEDEDNFPEFAEPEW
jgi:hypothetical protein